MFEHLSSKTLVRGKVVYDINMAISLSYDKNMIIEINTLVFHNVERMILNTNRIIIQILTVLFFYMKCSLAIHLKTLRSEIIRNYGKFLKNLMPDK